MFHSIVYKFTKVDNLRCSRVTIKKNSPSRSDGTEGIFLALRKFGLDFLLLEIIYRTSNPGVSYQKTFRKIAMSTCF